MASDRPLPGAGAFTFERDALALPPGATARTARTVLAHDGQPVLAFTQGPYRPCLHPVFTPAGYPVTAERPADHPHHAGVWIAAERVTWRAAGGPDEAHTYNFYVDEVFQGRAPGHIVERSVEFGQEAGTACVAQVLEWRGPGEWGAPEGRAILSERRTTRVTRGGAQTVIDVVSALRAAHGTVTIGPTRHAWFNVRVADRMSLGGAGTIVDSRGRRGGEAVSGEGAEWVQYAGPVGGGAEASVTVLAAPGSGGAWFAADWGVLTVGPFRSAAGSIEPGSERSLHYRIVVRDGPENAAAAAADHRAFPGSEP